MSNEAINWALTRPIKHSTAKFVLVVMANCADADSWEAWPSIAHLAESTGQDRKTVLENIKRLVGMGYITDTEQRKGVTKQVPIYRLNESVIGTVKESQKRNSTDNGTVPVFPSNSPVIPYEQSQISLVTVPKTGHGTQRNHQGTIKEPKKIVRTKPELASDVALPDWMPMQAWTGYLDMRKSKRKVPTPYALSLVLGDLSRFHAKGHDVAAVLDASTKNGWTDVYEPKAPQARGSPNSPQTATPSRHSNFEAINYREGIEDGRIT